MSALGIAFVVAEALLLAALFGLEPDEPSGPPIVMLLLIVVLGLGSGLAVSS